MMNTIESLNLRTNAAVGRAADLVRRAEKQATPSIAVTRQALKELTTALGQLQVANEQLGDLVSQLSAARLDGNHQIMKHHEFVNTLPLPCLWTDAQGLVDEANEASAMLLNVGVMRLSGKPLSLFITSRSAFFDGLAALRDGRTPLVEVVVQVRPRERRPRMMRLTGQRFEHDSRLCWFLRDEPLASAAFVEPRDEAFSAPPAGA